MGMIVVTVASYLKLPLAERWDIDKVGIADVDFFFEKLGDGNMGWDVMLIEE